MEHDKFYSSDIDIMEIRGQDDPAKRSFVSTDSPVTGKSVVRLGTPLVPLIPADREIPTAASCCQHNMADFLNKNIGKKIRAKLLLKTNGATIDKKGILIETGADYIVLQSCSSNDLLMYDLNSIKSIRIYN